MVVGILQVELRVDDAESLKDKRRIVQSIKDRLHREHQVSVAEVATQDDWHVATLGIALAASDVKATQSTLDQVLDKIRAKRDCYISDHKLEVLSGY